MTRRLVCRDAHGRAHRRERWRERWRERGAAAIVLAVVIAGVIVPVSAFAVDIGMQRVARRDAQAVADTAALDAARSLNATSTNDTVTAVAAKSAQGDSGAVGNDEGVVAKIGYIAPGVGWKRNQALGCDGTTYANDFFATTIPSGQTPNAVLVVVKNRVEFGLAKAMGASSGGVCRSSISKLTEPDACYKVSSYALGVDTSNSVLGPLLGLAGANQALTILSSNGVANANVSLLSLATQLGVGTPSQLVSMPSLTMGQFLLASATVLDNQGNTAQASALTNLNVALGSVAGQQMNLGSLVALGQGNASALDADVNVGDLVSGSLMVADGSSAINIPGLNLSVPGVGTLTASAKVVQPPVIGCNGATAKAAQVTIELKNTGGSLSIPLVASVSNFDVKISLANASASSDTTAACSTSSMKLNVTNQTLANIRLTADVKALFGLIPVASLDTGAPTSTSSSYALPIPGAYTTPVQAGSGTLGIDLSNASATVLGIIDLGSLVSLLQPVVNAVSTLVTGTLAPLLGLTVAGADLYAISPTPTCGGPKLVG